MNNEPKKNGLSKGLDRFLNGRGFYIALLLCVAVIGLSGYSLLTEQPEQEPPVLGGEEQAPVSGPVLLEEDKPDLPEADPPADVPVPEPAPESTAPVSDLVVWPVTGDCVAAFSADELQFNETLGDWRTHNGVDIAAEKGAPVKAASAGTVDSVAEDALLGTTVTISHQSGVSSVYANLSAAPVVEPGDRVVAGQIIGSVGRTAISESEGPDHLHFQVLRDGVSTDPMEFLP